MTGTKSTKPNKGQKAAKNSPVAPKVDDGSDIVEWTEGTPAPEKEKEKTGDKVDDGSDIVEWTEGTPAPVKEPAKLEPAVWPDIVEWTEGDSGSSTDDDEATEEPDPEREQLNAPQAVEKADPEKSSLPKPKKPKSYKGIGANGREKCKQEVANYLVQFKNLQDDPDIAAAVRFTKEITQGNQSLFNSLGKAYAFGLELNKLDDNHKHAFFEQITNLSLYRGPSLKYGKAMQANIFQGVIKMFFWEQRDDASLLTNYTNIITYASKQNPPMQPELLPDWVAGDHAYNDNKNIRIVRSGYTACIKEVAQWKKGKFDQGVVPEKKQKLTSVPDWVYGKTNASVDVDTPEWWDENITEGMALFKVVDGQLRVYNLLNTSIADTTKIIKDKYGSLDQTKFAGTEAPEVQLMFALKTIVNISQPSAIMVMQHNFIDADGDKCVGNHYVVPLYGCYTRGDQPWRQLKDHEDAKICPIVCIPYRDDAPELSLPKFPDFSNWLKHEQLDADDYVEERGILQCAYYTTDIKRINDWDMSQMAELEMEGDNNGQFWFMNALFRHMDYTQELMPSPYLPQARKGADFGRVDIDNIKTVMLGYKMDISGAIKSIDQEMVKAKRILTAKEWEKHKGVVGVSWRPQGISLFLPKVVSGDFANRDDKKTKIAQKSFNVSHGIKSVSDVCCDELLDDESRRCIFWTISSEALRMINRLGKPWYIIVPQSVENIQPNKDGVVALNQLWLQTKNLFVLINNP